MSLIISTELLSPRKSTYAIEKAYKRMDILLSNAGYR